MHAYLERVHSVTAPKPKVSQNGRERIEELLAAHIVGGSGWYLASWAGHRIMTWLSADIFKPPPPISLQGLVDDDGRELASTTDEYSMCVGELRKLRCCKRCDSASDGFDYRVFIDADTYGNVRALSNLTPSDLTDVCLGSSPATSSAFPIQNPPQRTDML